MRKHATRSLFIIIIDICSLPSLFVTTNYSINEYNVIFKERKTCLYLYKIKFTWNLREIILDFGTSRIVATGHLLGFNLLILRYRKLLCVFDYVFLNVYLFYFTLWIRDKYNFTNILFLPINILNILTLVRIHIQPNALYSIFRTRPKKEKKHIFIYKCIGWAIVFFRYLYRNTFRGTLYIIFSAL